MKLHKKAIWIFFIALILASFGYWQYKKSNAIDTEYTTVKVERGNLKQTISATGTIKPLTEVDLNFSNLGKIIVLNVKKGDRVQKDDILAKQDDTALQITIQQARANLDSSIAKLNKLKIGSSREDIAVFEKKVLSAKTTYDNAVKNLEFLRSKTLDDIKTYEEAVKSAKTSISDKTINLNDVKNKYSQSVKNLESSAISVMDSDIFTAESAIDSVDKALTNSGALTGQQFDSAISQTNRDDLVKAQNSYVEIIEVQDAITKQIALIKKDGIDVSAVLGSDINTLNKIKDSLSLAFLVLQNTVANVSYSQASIDTNKTDLISKQATIKTAIDSLENIKQDLVDARLNYDNQVNSAQALLNTAQDNLTISQANLSAAESNRDLQISKAEAEIDSALATLKLAESELLQIKASPRQIDLASQEAEVKQYEASLALAQDNWKKTILTSPINGIVTKINYEIGEQTTASAPVISLVTDGDYSIEVDISETDIVKVSNNDTVDTTFDSLGDSEIFKGKVLFIDPAQTIISDVVYYNVKIVIEKSENNNFDKIKPGMTANIDILTDYKENILFVPARAVQEKNGKNYVRILERKGKEVSVREEAIGLGINGDDGMVEIYNDLQAGQEVVTFVKNVKK